MDAATEFFKSADKIQRKPLTEAQWVDSVEFYQRAKSQTDALNDLSLIHISEPTRRHHVSRMPSSA